MIVLHLYLDSYKLAIKYQEGSAFMVGLPVNNMNVNSDFRMVMVRFVLTNYIIEKNELPIL